MASNLHHSQKDWITKKTWNFEVKTFQFALKIFFK
jgi:hypothetical protein